MNSPGSVERLKTRVPRSAWGWGLRFVVFATVSSLGAFVDLATKSYVFTKWGYPDGRSRAFLDHWVMFRFHTSFNRGALWGIGQSLTWLFALLSFLAVCVILYWLFIRGAAKSWLLTLCLASIMAGTLGNLYDRLGLHGCIDPFTKAPIYGVRDFLLFRFGTYNWPVFNLADVLLVSGAVGLITQALFGRIKNE